MRGFSVTVPWGLRFLSAAVAFATLWVFPAGAQERNDAGATRIGISAPEAESLRADMLDILETYHRIGIEGGMEDVVEVATRALEIFRQMPAEELVPFTDTSWLIDTMRRTTADLESVWDESNTRARADEPEPPNLSVFFGACCNTTVGGAPGCTDNATCELSVCSNDANVVCSGLRCSHDQSIVCSDPPDPVLDCGLDANDKPRRCVAFTFGAGPENLCAAGGSCLATDCTEDAGCDAPNTTIDQGDCLPRQTNFACQGEVQFHPGDLCSEIASCPKINDPTHGSLPAAPNTPGENCARNRIDTNLALVGLIAVQVGKLENIIAQSICSQLFAGFNGELACIAFDLAFLVQRSLFDHVLRCVSAVDTVEIKFGYKRAEHIHAELELAQKDDDHTSLLVNKKLLIDARVRIIAFIKKMSGGLEAQLRAAADRIKNLFRRLQCEQNIELRAFRTYSLQILIENDLGTPFEQNREARFQLPRAFVCPDKVSKLTCPCDDPTCGGPVEINVPCGALEDVRQVVADTIANMTAAGMPVFGAPDLLIAGDDEFTNTNYKFAYALYATAYRLATGLQSPPAVSASRNDGGRGASGSRLMGGGQ